MEPWESCGRAQGVRSPGPQLALRLPIRCYADLCKEFPFPGSQFPYIQKMRSLNQKISKSPFQLWCSELWPRRLTGSPSLPSSLLRRILWLCNTSSNPGPDQWSLERTPFDLNCPLITLSVQSCFVPCELHEGRESAYWTCTTSAKRDLAQRTQSLVFFFFLNEWVIDFKKMQSQRTRAI